MVEGLVGCGLEFNDLAADAKTQLHLVARADIPAEHIATIGYDSAYDLCQYRLFYFGRWCRFLAASAECECKRE